MICPKCNISFSPRPYYESVKLDDRKDEELSYTVTADYCPECEQLIVAITHHEIDYFDIRDAVIIFPDVSEDVINNQYVPENYLNAYNEALIVKKSSNNASAALSRRLLQNIIRNTSNIKKSNLYEEIKEFKEKEILPEYLKESLDLIRTYGNKAAHPLKSINTGVIEDVSVEEAEWSLKLIKELFEYIFIRPGIHEEHIKSHKLKSNNKN